MPFKSSHKVFAFASQFVYNSFVIKTPLGGCRYVSFCTRNAHQSKSRQIQMCIRDSPVSCSRPKSARISSTEYCFLSLIPASQTLFAYSLFCPKSHPLAGNFIHQDSPRDRCIQRSHPAAHRQADAKITFLQHQAADALSFRADHQSAWAGKILLTPGGAVHIRSIEPKSLLFKMCIRDRQESLQKWQKSSV